MHNQPGLDRAQALAFLQRGNDAFPELVMRLREDLNFSFKIEDGALSIRNLAWRAPQAWLHQLCAPLSIQDVSRVESQCNIWMPADYKSLLSFFNGGTLFFCDVDIWGQKQTAKVVQPPFDLVQANIDVRASIPEIDERLFAIATYSYGGLICIDLSRSDISTAAVGIWDLEDAKLQPVLWRSIRSWLAHEIQESAKEWDRELAEQR